MIADLRRVVHLRLQVLSLSSNLLNGATIAALINIWFLKMQELYLSQVC